MALMEVGWDLNLLEKGEEEEAKAIHSVGHARTVLLFQLHCGVHNGNHLFVSGMGQETLPCIVTMTH
jgi:hypothetical protein